MLIIFTKYKKIILNTEEIYMTDRITTLYNQYIAMPLANRIELSKRSYAKMEEEFKKDEGFWDDKSSKTPMLIVVALLLAIGVGVFILGCSIAIFAFNYVRNASSNAKKKEKVKNVKVKSVTYTLIKKEFKLLAQNSDYSFSFLGLLVIQPLLAYLVIKALNTIFTTGVFAYYISMVPNFLPLLDVLILMFFTVIINQGANSYIQMEKKTIKVMKTIPVSYKKQLLVKVSIPFTLSFTSLLITLLVLVIGKVISPLTFIFSLLLVGLLLVIFEINILFPVYKNPIHIIAR
jgi:uncharacterized protein YxeA